HLSLHDDLPLCPSPSTGASTRTPRSIPASRRSCSDTTSPSNARWVARSTCWKSQPPQPPGPAYSQRLGTLPAAATRTSTASARRNRDVSPPSVILARTRSPGRLCRTNTTRPARRATQCPPCAIGPTSTSTSSPITVTVVLPCVQHPATADLTRHRPNPLCAIAGDPRRPQLVRD